MPTFGGAAGLRALPEPCRHADRYASFLRERGDHRVEVVCRGCKRVVAASLFDGDKLEVARKWAREKVANSLGRCPVRGCLVTVPAAGVSLSTGEQVQCGRGHSLTLRVDAAGVASLALSSGR